MKKAKRSIEKNYAKNLGIQKYVPAIDLKKIPPEKAFTILRKAGYDINEEQSEEIMEFLYILVKLTLKEFFASD